MTSILEKIGKAINCSRRASDLVITEDQQTTTRKLFISGTMDNDTLQLWGDVIDTDAENLRITFVDESRDDIHPAQGVPGQKHFITIISDEIPGILRLFTLEGWRTFLLQDPRLRQYHRIYALFVNESFETQQWKVVPWKQMQPEESETNAPTRTVSATKSIIRCFSTDFLPPDTITPWILISGDKMTDEPMKLWASLACRELLKCFANELFSAEIKKVGLSGKPPRKISFGEEHETLSAFDVIQETAKWIFLEGDEIELKHTFLSSELAREWPEGVTFCEGIVYRLPPALESARLLYKAHIRTGGKDTLKSLGDLRKKPDRGYPKNSAAVARPVFRVVERYGPGYQHAGSSLQSGGSEGKWSAKSVCPGILCTGPVYRHLIRGVGLYQQAFPFTAGKKQNHLEK